MHRWLEAHLPFFVVEISTIWTLHRSESLGFTLPTLIDYQIVADEHGTADGLDVHDPRNPLGPNELVSSVIDSVARDYLGHVIRKQQRRAGES
jgi:hypothetical protein